MDFVLSARTKKPRPATRKKHAANSGAELAILRLAAMGSELRHALSLREIRRIPSLDGALSALDRVMKELGWDDDNIPPP